MTDLGNRLKEAREAKGLSLDELQNITKIQKRYLIGIEEGNYAIMPGKFYVRAFIKQYAEAVDLNPEEIFDIYKGDVPSVVSTELPELSRVQSRKNITDGNSKVLDALPKLLIAIFLIGAAALIYYFLQQNAGDNSNEQLESGNEPVKYENLENKKDNQNQKDNNDSSESKTHLEDTNLNTDGNSNTESGEDLSTGEEAVKPTQEVTVVSSSGSDTVYELKNTDRFDLKLVSTGETWVNMKNGKGYSLYQGMLKKGQVESQMVDYSKETEAVLVIGNTINTEIYINDQKIDYAIAPTDEVKQDIVIRFIPKVE
ncbi:MAG TPA: RodZ domain-containing protein [Pseudoneobacillus sp.]|nr:RodZ domain-containing protein [Pseudoneobacillus sp.]